MEGEKNDIKESTVDDKDAIKTQNKCDSSKHRLQKGKVIFQSMIIDRVVHRRACRKIGCYQIVLGCIMVFCNFLGVVLPKRAELKTACYLSGGFICGLSAIGAGIIGIYASKKDNNKYQLTGCLLVSILALVSAVYVIALGIFGLRTCYKLGIDELDIFILIYIVFEVTGISEVIFSSIQCHICLGGEFSCIDLKSPPKPIYVETTAIYPPCPAAYGIELPCAPHRRLDMSINDYEERLPPKNMESNSFIDYRDLSISMLIPLILSATSFFVSLIIDLILIIHYCFGEKEYADATAVFLIFSLLLLCIVTLYIYVSDDCGWTEKRTYFVELNLGKKYVPNLKITILRYVFTVLQLGVVVRFVEILMLCHRYSKSKDTRKKAILRKLICYENFRARQADLIKVYTESTSQAIIQTSIHEGNFNGLRMLSLTWSICCISFTMIDYFGSIKTENISEKLPKWRGECLSILPGTIIQYFSYLASLSSRCIAIGMLATAFGLPWALIGLALHMLIVSILFVGWRNVNFLTIEPHALMGWYRSGLHPSVYPKKRLSINVLPLIPTCLRSKDEIDGEVTQSTNEEAETSCYKRKDDSHCLPTIDEVCEIEPSASSSILIVEAEVSQNEPAYSTFSEDSYSEFEDTATSKKAIDQEQSFVCGKNTGQDEAEYVNYTDCELDGASPYKINEPNTNSGGKSKENSNN
ncbi:DgyrCDS13164 [Dimorphilus gyrociliatus]|uniref:DgyrCDS13164 n=1 Tax=Dimorphilus gyrociliatus TaxID=2664684 RepID=A0A7I8W9V3_9ANNE|nr:DgyrCDS13164 [Dimorphilus gyrociliatus]